MSILLPHNPRIKADSILLTLALFSLLVFGVWGIRSLIVDIAFLNLEIKEGRRYNAQLETKITAVDRGKAALIQIADRLETIDDTVPSDPLEAELVEELAMDGGKTAFSLTSTSFGGKKVEDGVSSQVFECAFKGGAANIIPLLEEIESGRLIRINDLQYTQEKSEGRSLTAISIKGENFYYEEGKE